MGCAMVQRFPTVVGLYLREGQRWRRIAEFRVNTEGHATFRAIDPVEGLVGRVWFQQGVDILGEQRTVLPGAGAEFLWALLQPFGFRDYLFRDDSVPAEAGARPRPGRTRSHGASAGRNGSGDRHCARDYWPAARTVRTPSAAPTSPNPR